jgi:hypothetical protein
MMRWGMPPPPRSFGPPVTNIRNTSSPHWRGWLKPENRCLVPFNSFAEYAPEPNPETTISQSGRSAAELVVRNQRDDPLKSIFSAAQLKLIDKWIFTTDPTLDRPEAVRRLLEIGRKAKK